MSKAGALDNPCDEVRRIPLGGFRQVEMLRTQLKHLRQAYAHPNRSLFYDDLVCTYLLAFYNPTVRSLRLIEDMSRREDFARRVGSEPGSIGVMCRSTMSDANRLFDPALLGPLIRDLKSRIPGSLKQRDPKLSCLLKQAIAADGSMFTIAADVAWALHHTKTNGKSQGQVRLNMQLDVLTGLPEHLSFSGQAQGKESAAMAADLKPQVIYIVDRGYVDFAFINAVLAVNSDLVLRAKSDAPHFACEKENRLTEEDRRQGILSDRIGRLPGSRGACAPAPDQEVREVIVLDPATGKPVRLITTLLEVPAHVITLLYRYRWQIELFFRWLKVHAGMEHLISHCRQGMEIQFYCAVIGVLLFHIYTQRRAISKYALNQLALSHGQMQDWTAILPILERRERERQLERERLARKKAAKNQTV